LESNISEAETEQLPAEFTAAAAPESTRERVTVTLDLDADVLEWLKAQHLGWQHELNTLARFWMETSNQPVPPPHEFHRFTYDPEVSF
jgi:uncharacterized protein (DUF4415 family)